MIITIDGPAGAGKSTVARQLAAKLGFEFLDTGAMYRAMVVAAMDANIQLEDAASLFDCCSNADLEFGFTNIRLNDENISDRIRLPEVSNQVKYVADHQDIRKLLVQKQRDLANAKDIVCEGRDQGTVAFPHAECKFFLTATSEERAKRRVEDLQSRGIDASYDSVKREQDLRDEHDKARPFGGLVQAEDAIEIVTDGLAIPEVVEKLANLVNEHRESQPNSN